MQNIFEKGSGLKLTTQGDNVLSLKEGYPEAVVQRCSMKKEACNFFKKRFQLRCFPVNNAEFLRTPILKNIYIRLLLDIISSSTMKFYQTLNKYVQLQISSKKEKFCFKR